MERITMKRSEPPARQWKTPLTFVGVFVVGLAALLVGVAIFSCDIDALDDKRGLSDGLRALISREKKAVNVDKKTADKKRRGNYHKHVMQLQGQWNGLTLSGTDGRVPGMPAQAGRPGSKGVMVMSIDPLKGGRAQAAGITAGDLIVGVDDKPVTGLADLHVITHTINAREPLMISVLRQGQVHALILAPEPTPNPIGVAAALNGGPGAFCPRDGILVPTAQAGNGICPICNGPLQVYTPNTQAPQARR